LLHGECAGAARLRNVATRRVCRCRAAAQRCYTGGAHVRTGRAALLHRRCARVRRLRSIATQGVRTCAPGAQHCYTGGAHVCAGCAALLHRGCAHVRRACNVATQGVRTCAPGAQHCYTRGCARAHRARNIATQGCARAARWRNAVARRVRTCAPDGCVGTFGKLPQAPAVTANRARRRARQPWPRALRGGRKCRGIGGRGGGRYKISCCASTTTPGHAHFSGALIVKRAFCNTSSQPFRLD